jgi:hypothetical protein
MIPTTARRTALCLALLGAACLACATDSARTGGAAAAVPQATQDPAAVLSKFVDALEAGRWADAHALLSARWRAAYTPSRLASDFGGAGPLAREAAAHARTALVARASMQIADGRASLPVAGGRALLVAEAAGWRVDALE